SLGRYRRPPSCVSTSATAPCARCTASNTSSCQSRASRCIPAKTTSQHTRLTRTLLSTTFAKLAVSSHSMCQEAIPTDTLSTLDVWSAIMSPSLRSCPLTARTGKQMQQNWHTCQKN
ncbi:hypothetical protein GGH92_009440, partial [Coemansia sp. RSA 2673]